MPRKIADLRKKQVILIPVRVNEEELIVLKRGAVLARLPPATFARIATLDRASETILQEARRRYRERRLRAALPSAR
jgi:hypothetical protein